MSGFPADRSTPTVGARPVASDWRGASPSDTDTFLSFTSEADDRESPVRKADRGSDGPTIRPVPPHTHADAFAALAQRLQTARGAPAAGTGGRRTALAMVAVGVVAIPALSGWFLLSNTGAPDDVPLPTVSAPVFVPRPPQLTSPPIASTTQNLSGTTRSMAAAPDRRPIPSVEPPTALSRGGAIARADQGSRASSPQGALFINARPWADVWVDGQPAGTTPLANVRVTPGTHEILWRHPQLGERRQTVLVGDGSPTRVGMDLRTP